MNLLAAIPFLKPIISEIRQEKRIAGLEKERDEYKQKFLDAIDAFNKHLKGELIKSRGKHG